MPPKSSYNKDFTVDTHSHIFMEEGLTFIFHGSFFEKLQATNWKSRFSSHTNVETLEQSDIGLLVIALYAHPWLTNQREAIRKQIKLAEKFVNEYPNWVIAKNPHEAWNAYKKGKRIIILSLEAAAGVLETEEDIKEFVDKLGVSIVTLIHMKDDHLGGAAFMGSYKYIFNPIAWFKSFFNPEFDRDIRLNPIGLSQKGEKLVKLLLKHKVWLDLTHASEKSYNQLLSILKKAKQPLLFTHLTPREFRRAESGISEEQLEDVRKSGGIVGINPSQELLRGDKKIREKYTDSFKRFIAAYKLISGKVGANATVFGTDFNAPITHLSPPKKSTKTEIDKNGFWHIGQTKELWDALAKSGAETSQPRSKSIEYFLDTWSKVWQ